MFACIYQRYDWKTNVIFWTWYRHFPNIVMGLPYFIVSLTSLFYDSCVSYNLDKKIKSCVSKENSPSDNELWWILNVRSPPPPSKQNSRIPRLVFTARKTSSRNLIAKNILFSYSLNISISYLNKYLRMI